MTEESVESWKEEQEEGEGEQEQGLGLGVAWWVAVIG